MTSACASTALLGWPRAFGQSVNKKARKANVIKAVVISFIIKAGKKEMLYALLVPTGLLEPTV